MFKTIENEIGVEIQIGAKIGQTYTTRISKYTDAEGRDCRPCYSKVSGNEIRFDGVVKINWGEIDEMYTQDDILEFAKSTIVIRLQSECRPGKSSKRTERKQKAADDYAEMKRRLDAQEMTPGDYDRWIRTDLLNRI